MFTTTLSMWLGILFLALCIIAVLLQAWLWGPPYWDEEARKTRAPRKWLRIHAAAGYGYGLIYLFMMWHMFPRLWEYQYELPARTVVHAVVAIVIGVILVSKVAILRFFRHFEEAMPRFGFALLLCTVVLTSLSVPHAVRAADLYGDASTPENLARVQRLLADVEMETDITPAQLATERGLERGRRVLVSKCTACHDMRTILLKPRTAARWHDVSARMLGKPTVFGDRLDPADIPWVTAYLVAITPEIQESLKRSRQSDVEQEDREEAVGEAVHEADAFEAPALDEAAARALVNEKCTECHELDEIDAHGPDDVAGWKSVVAAMVEEGAEISDEEAIQISTFLAGAAATTGGEPLASAATAEDPPLDPDPGAAAESEPVPTPAPAPEKKRQRRRPPEPEVATDPPPPARPGPGPAGNAPAGKELFMKKCKTCHGTDGEGETAYGKKIGVASLTETSLGRAGLRGAIANGRSGTKMKAYRDKLTPEEIDDLTAFVMSLR